MCEHILERQVNDDQYKLMSSYIEGMLPYFCKKCGDIFWVKPLAIRVLDLKKG